MFDYIKGTVTELTPAKAVIEYGGIGFDIQISLQTFQALQNKEFRLAELGNDAGIYGAARMLIGSK